MKNSQWIRGLLPALMVLAGPQTQGAEQYRLDSRNTQVSFSVQHLGILFVTARFSDINGRFLLDRVGGSKVDVTVGIASLNCNESRWNDRLRSKDWLDAEHFPHMIYHSSRIAVNDHDGVAEGELTLHGVTRPIVLKVNVLDCPASGHCRFAADGRIKRSEYGLPHGFWSGGDIVQIAISGAVGSDSTSATVRTPNG